MSDTAGSRTEGAVDQLLLEAGMGGDGQLRDALLDLRALAADAPAPSAEIAALMAGAPTTALPAVASTVTTALPATRPADELAARRKAKRRITLTTLSVAASLAAGGAVAAASDQGFRDSFAQLNHAVTAFVTGSAATPGGNTGQAPAPQPGTTRPPATSSADAVPPASPPASAPSAVAPSEVPARPDNAPTHGAAAQKPAEAPAGPSLPANVQEDVRKGLEQSPKLPVPVPTEIPLPGKSPGIALK
ncbi:hypothetical protein [Pseudarthrobacter enclensis]|uniref:Anti-sigma-D factor RsdA sigma factor binding region domain-containing protein n=1 Tax=Pseudarthrobacter enclensis TaxID=993070 RepID=A0ABT9RPA5_9MICC|nr:hypothetical protein [Pseudarthrobacter enclensis]MDP9886887.1 hypothetical protein [Pseudarthrobacter enclensis]